MTSRTEISEGNGMGSTVGDYDNDGDIDWFVSSINGNAVYNNEDGIFSRNRDAGVSGGGWGWGSCFADFDADGFLDIYQTNGWINNIGGNPNEPYTEDASRLWMSNGDKTFTRADVEAEIIDTEQGRGVICADFDGDLDVDVLLLINNAEKGVFLFDNMIDTKNAISIDLQGIAPNTKAIGARITITADGKTQTRELRIGSNFTAHDPTQQIIGIGDESMIEQIRIVWPDGKVTEDNDVGANRSLSYAHPDL